TKFTGDELKQHLPLPVRREIVRKEIQFYVVDAEKISTSVGLAGRFNMVMQTVFFKLSGILSLVEAIQKLKTFIKKIYGRKGDDIVNANYECVDRTLDEGVIKQIEYDDSWASDLTEADKDLVDTRPSQQNKTAFVKDIVEPVLKYVSESVPVSKIPERGIIEVGSGRFQKRGTAIKIPVWNADTCIQCGACAIACPHAVIRPFLLTEDETKSAPATMDSANIKNKKFASATGTQKFVISVSPYDCTGCSNCVMMCPTREKGTLKMELIGDVLDVKSDEYEYVRSLENRGHLIPDKLKKLPVGASLQKPLLEFHLACGGCQEMAQIKNLANMFGDNLMIANATGCSSVTLGAYPFGVWSTNHKGQGPAWANSLFEDNAEFGFGMHLATKQRRARVAGLVSTILSRDESEGVLSDKLHGALKQWFEVHGDKEESRIAADNIKEELKKLTEDDKDTIHIKIPEFKEFNRIDSLDQLGMKSQWIVGGDGWAYDIGFGGVDHVLASGENVNILICDTEVYSNTGGQRSKATPAGAVARFAAGGKEVVKKDILKIAMTYPNVYVASVALNANQSQFLKAIAEADAHDGPSIVLAYSPCIEHGIRKGLAYGPHSQKLAVETGYWLLYRYNPALVEKGKNPLTIDSKAPSKDPMEFLETQARFNSLIQTKPEVAKRLDTLLIKDMLQRYLKLVELRDSFKVPEERIDYRLPAPDERPIISEISSPAFSVKRPAIVRGQAPKGTVKVPMASAIIDMSPKSSEKEEEEEEKETQEKEVRSRFQKDEEEEVVEEKVEKEEEEGAEAGVDGPIKVFFATETGNSEAAAEEIASELGVDDPSEVSEFDYKSLLHGGKFVFVCSTTGHGNVPVSGEVFYEWLSEQKDGSFSKVKIACLGLGCSDYEVFNGGMKKCVEHFKRLGATLVCPALYCDDNDEDGYETQLAKFIPLVKEAKW
ncbi:Pyruvate:ferredoxin oxidoreductase, partial [Aduncisulcus paluster]